MNTLKTITKVKASRLSATLRRQFGVTDGQTVKLSAEPLPSGEKDPWLSIQGTLSLQEGIDLRKLTANSRRSRKEIARLA